MRILHTITFKPTTQPYPVFLRYIGCVAFVLFLYSCSTVPQTQLKTQQDDDPIDYSLVFLIHGDGDYLYHDTGGFANKADEKALQRAQRVAEQNPQAEVFIFHQKPRKHTLFFFPRRDGKLYYYRNGRLLAEEKYRRNQGDSRFDPEVQLYHRFRAKEHPRPVTMFLYFGHDIPEFDGRGYDASYRNEIFTVDDLAGGLRRFTGESGAFDLVVLSTCFNGTPHSIGTLSPYAQTIIASPDDLHLSYLDLKPFERLETGLRDGDTEAFAKNFAQHAFNRLTEYIHTSVAITVYNVDRVQEYVHAVDSAYNKTLTLLEELNPGFPDYIDCGDDSAYTFDGMSDGVKVFYRPPRFGRLQNKQSHSGWGCPVRPE